MSNVISIKRHQEGQECAMCEQAYEHTPEWEQLELDFDSVS
jgi:hypothetical protein